ncbi:MAG: hypothetical protein AAB585_00830 [Patescibacteria group bacterium]|mgnify:CR=1 FL=1
MKETELLAEYTAHARELDFIADPAEPAWQVSVYPGEFREIKQHGTRFGQPVTFNAIDRQYLPENHNQQLEILLAYNQLVEKRSVSDAPVIRLPAVQCMHDYQATLAIVWEKPEGQRIISDEEYGKYFSRGDAIWRKIEETATLIRLTVEQLEDLRFHNSDAVGELLHGKSYADYFLERFSRWNAERQKAGKISDYDQLEQQKFAVLRTIFSRGSTAGTGLQLAWNVCGNTDIIKTADGQYYLVNGRFEAKPPSFLPAAWIWNLTLHGAWLKSSEQLVENILDCCQIFSVQRFFSPFLNDNLLERLFAARWVDADLRRSPFNRVSDLEWQRAIDNLDYVLRQLLRSL